MIEYDSLKLLNPDVSRRGGVQKPAFGGCWNPKFKFYGMLTFVPGNVVLPNS